MPVDVGNSLYKYIMAGRPCGSSDYVFITHRVPYGRLNTSCCKRALAKALDKEKTGFHITRKTFASRMLKTRTNTETIADSLGHSNNSTVLKYLSTDADTMRQCAISLKGIEVKGGMLS
jgi:integrase